MEYQWYPGHMKKAYRQMQEDIALIDLVIEVCDARIVRSSRNPDIDGLVGGKGRVLLLAKSDLADEKKTKKWLAYFKENNIMAIAADMRGSTFTGELKSVIDTLTAAKRERDLKRGIKNRPVRAMVCGIPNSGKSTFINSFVKKTSAKTGNKPGVTKGKQWIHMDKGVDLLDTPGILYPKFEDQRTGLYLALCGSINDNILDKRELAAELLSILRSDYPGLLEAKYFPDAGPDETGDNVPAALQGTGYELLERIAAAKKLLKTGGVPDVDAAASLLVDDFRKGRLGAISLEEP